MSLTFRLLFLIILSCIVLTCTEEPDAMDLAGVWRIETNAVHLLLPFFGAIDDEIRYTDDFNTPYLEVIEGNVYYYTNDGCGTGFNAINYDANIDGAEGQINEFYLPEDDTLFTQATLYTLDSKLVLEYDFSVPWGEYRGVITATYYEGPMPPSAWSTTLEADIFEPDSLNAPGTTLIVNGDPIGFTILEDDRDYFSFTADVAGTYNVLVEGPGAPRMDEKFHVSGSGSWGPNYARAQHNITEPGEYVLWVYSEDGCAPYTIKVSTNSFE